MASIGGDTNTLVRKFMKRGRRKPTPADRTASFPKQGQGANAKFSRGTSSQYYVSQGRAVENAANTQRYNTQRAASERKSSQDYYRHKLGYDKPGVTPKKAKRAVKKAYHKINPFD